MGKMLVTGGAGFIGSHLVKALLNRGHRVTVFDNFSTGKRSNLKGCGPNLKVIKGDIRNHAALKKAMQKTDRVFHLAAISSVPQSVDNPIETADVNISGTWNVLESARLAGVGRVVFVSSASVYGSDQKLPFKEQASVKGSSPYAASKLVGEQICELYRTLYGLDTVALRLFSVYGPRQNRHSQYSNVIPAFASRLLSGKRPIIYGDGKQTRDFVFVEDVARAFLKASRLKKAVGAVINVGSGKQMTINRLFQDVSEVLNVKLKAEYQPAKPGDDPHTCAHIERSRRLLGLTKLTPFMKGLAKTVTWFREDMEAEREVR